MCNLVSPQRHVMSSSYIGAGGSLVTLSRTFMATILDAKEFICQVETAFGKDLWPTVDAELANSRRRVMELERLVEESSKQLEEREQLELVRENERACLLTENRVLRMELEQLSRSFQEGEERLRLESEKERTRLLAENGVLRTEFDQLSRHQAEGVQKEGTRAEEEKVVHENQILQTKLQLLLEENLEGEKRRKSLAEEVEQLQEAAKLSTIKEMALEAENKKFARARSRIEKSEAEDAKRLSLVAENRNFAIEQYQVQKPDDLHSKRLSLRGRSELANDESPRTTTAGRDLLPVSSEDPQNSKEKPLVQSVYRLQDIDQGVDSAAFDLGKEEEIRDRAPVDPEADIDVNGAIPFDNRPSAEAKCQRDRVTDPEADDAQEIMCSQRPKANCGAGSSPGPRPGFVDSDAATTLGLDAVQDDPPVGICEEYPLISIESETQAEPCGDEPFQLQSRSVIEVLLRGGAVKENVEKDTVVVQKAAPPVLIATSVSSKRLLSRKKATTQKPAKKPKDKAWIRTKNRTKPSDRDPHDSFLDTPRERILAELFAAQEQEVGTTTGGLNPVTSKLHGGSVEARAVENAVRGEKQTSESLRFVGEVSNAGQPNRTGARAPALMAPPVKFNEPVRKKSDREALKGTDCKQCRKFYDAVQAGDASGAEASRCEHYNNVSRHRYKYLPPPTPEGFWNIGFDDSNSAPG